MGARRPRQGLGFRVLGLAALLGSPAAAQQAASGLVSNCVPCHGTEGIAKFADVPNLAGQNELYLLAQLRAFQTGKRVHKEMRTTSRMLSDPEMEAIAAYYARLPPR